ncbi:hypothetical protein [Williamsia soli]|uniref:hypothetical protein n=1 Tax=Williamsia soli TaxID=364929 RepID=UPI001A9D4064|nr:hypothetical protein [Williamsia soli]
MSTGLQVTTDVSVARPRRAVIDEAWRRIGPGLEVLSSTDGGPLRRTVKRILDPLVLRLRVNPQFSTPILAGEAAAAVDALITAHGRELVLTATWFTFLKKARKRLRITTGNAQEMYFPICFELAVTVGVPQADADDVAEATLLELHGDRDRTAGAVLTDHLSDPAVVDKLTRQLAASWGDVAPGGSITGPFLSGLPAVLGPADDHSSRGARQRVWSALIADETPFNLGALARDEVSVLPWSIVDVGLSSVAPQQRPTVLGEPRGDRPLDRTVAERVRATLRRGLDQTELPDVPLLCDEEVDRACAPWGLLGEDRQATLIAGIEVAVDLVPLDEKHTPQTALAMQIQARLRKEAYVLHARRCLAGDTALHPRQQRVVDDLRAFARPYLSRLWARLHGRDVWQETCADVDDVRALLDGVARSTSLDQRQRIKAMLENQLNPASGVAAI